MLSKKDIFIQRTFFALFWVIGCFGFIYQEIIPPLELLFTPMNLLADGVILMLGLLTLRKKIHILMISIFFAATFVSSCFVNNMGLVQWANGTRSFFGILFLIPVFHHFWSTPTRHRHFITALDKHLFIWLCVQPFCVVYQFLRYGAGDQVGGSFGDGGSSIVSFGIYFASFYLLNKRLDQTQVFKSIRDNIWLVILLFPTFLNETKVSFILLLMYFFLLFPINRSYIKRVLVISPVVLLLTGGAIWVYIETVDRSDDMLNPKFLMEEYLYSDYSVEELAGAMEWVAENENQLPDIPRFAKIGFIPYIIDENGGHWMEGLGLQGFSGSVSLGENKLVSEYNWFFIGTNPYVCYIIIQIGIIGVIWTLIFYYQMFFFCPPGYQKNKNIHIFAILCFIILLFYADMVKTLFFSFLYFLFCFLQWKPEETTQDNGTRLELLANSL